MFTGFTDETVDFMWGIRFNNERAWFEAHKEIYLTHFYQPMRELGDELYDYIAAKRPDLGLIRKVTRIYRDVRRLHGRGPYKERPKFNALRIPCSLGSSSTIRSFTATDWPTKLFKYE